MPVSRVDTGRGRVSFAATINAPVSELFDLVADPQQHGRLDGSGSVVDVVYGPDRLELGARFSIKMKMFGAPYRITSVVTAFLEGRLVEWRHPAGHRWRWEFAPAGPEGAPSSALVTETFDYAAAGRWQAHLYELVGFPRRNANGIEDTLHGLQRRYRLLS